VRLAPLVGIALLVVAAGCAAPVARDVPTTDRPEPVGSETPETGPAPQDPTTDGPDDEDGTPDPGPEFEDPETDVRGWENGYWADEPIGIDQSDGVDEEERAAAVARSMARVERVRGVEFDRDVTVEVVTREEFASGPVGGGDGGSGNGPSAEALYRDARFEALFLLGEDTGGGNATDRNNQQSVQGYYDPGRDRVVLVSPTETPRIDEGTLSQELFHAHQYRNLLPNRIPALSTYDGRQAVLSVVEGDANLVQYRYERNCEEEWSCLSRGSPASGGDDGTNDDEGGDADDGSSGFSLGLYLLQYFPYAAGEQYVREVYDRSGWSGVDALYEDFPTTSAAVIHSADLPATDVDVPVPDAEGWTLVERPRRGNYGTVGEAGLAGMFAYTLYDDRNATLVRRSAFLNGDDGTLDSQHPLNYSLRFSDGWRGDRFRVFRNGAGETAYVIRVRFVDAGAATEFASRYRDLLRYQGGNSLSEGTFRIDEGRFADAFSVHRTDATVTIANAPTTEALEAIAPGESDT
jgi:hypothetical protein